MRAAIYHSVDGTTELWLRADAPVLTGQNRFFLAPHVASLYSQHFHKDRYCHNMCSTLGMIFQKCR
jgi:hypothetical protein